MSYPPDALSGFDPLLCLWLAALSIGIVAAALADWWRHH